MSDAGALQHAEAGTSLWQDAWVRLRRNRLAVFGLVADLSDMAEIASGTIIGCVQTTCRYAVYGTS